MLGAVNVTRRHAPRRRNDRRTRFRPLHRSPADHDRRQNIDPRWSVDHRGGREPVRLVKAAIVRCAARAWTDLAQLRMPVRYARAQACRHPGPAP